MKKMKNREYKDAWLNLKDKIMYDYILENMRLSTASSLDDEELKDFYMVRCKGKISKINDVLTTMDKMDGSNDFGNLLYDLGIVKETESEWLGIWTWEKSVECIEKYRCIIQQ